MRWKAPLNAFLIALAGASPRDGARALFIP